MHEPCRVALQAAATSPAAAHLAAKRFSAPGVLRTADSPRQVAAGVAGSKTSLAASHVSSMVCIVGLTARACWLALSQEEKLRPGHYQALLDTFLTDGLFCEDKPAGLRQDPGQSADVAAACCISLYHMIGLQLLLSELDSL